jgi:hypothetical protein
MGGGDLFPEDDPLDGLDLKYLQEPRHSDFMPRKLIGGRLYSEQDIKCSAGCGRRVYIYHYRNGSKTKRKTCGDPDCIGKMLGNSNRKRGKRRGNSSRADYGTVYPLGTPFRETEITEEEINRIIDEGDRKTWRL